MVSLLNHGQYNSRVLFCFKRGDRAFDNQQNLFHLSTSLWFWCENKEVIFLCALITRVDGGKEMEGGFYEELCLVPGQVWSGSAATRTPAHFCDT